MSPANRGTQWSNSGMVVQLNPEEVEGDDVLRILRYQERFDFTAMILNYRIFHIFLILNRMGIYLT